MELPFTVNNLLRSNDCRFRQCTIDPRLSQDEKAAMLSAPDRIFIRAVVLMDERGYAMAVLQQPNFIDFAAIKKFTGRNLRPVSIQDSQKIYVDCDKGCVPPLPHQKVEHIFIDKALSSAQTVIIESGRHETLLHMGIDDFLALHPGATRLDISANEQDVSIDEDTISQVSISTSLTPDSEKQDQLRKLYSLPAMPDIAHQILRLKSDPLADAQRLAETIQMDPSLTSQIIRYAKSAFYGYQGEVNSVQEAISRVLGFEMVMNMAFGISAGKSLKNPPHGPLGLRAFWKHATLNACLTQKLCRALPKEYQANHSMAYLAGLLHNFGFLLLGHLFQPEFFLLNKLYAANPKQSIQAIESHALGMGGGQEAIHMGHAELGAWLMEHWNMPEPIIASVKHHHNADYDDKHAIYPLLVNVVNSGLGMHEIGDDRRGQLDDALCERLGLNPEFVQEELSILLAERQQLEAIATQFVA